ncbi:GNAT family N-acetyltransferase [Blautia hansenii]|uniref:GNAT family N-acetyltransferase n=1 Tax=Blautia hansenii TaxID=1322 RepID=UPI0039843957
MITYRKALPKDFPHILDFLNMVFSMSHCPHDFRQLLPKIYKEGQEQKSIHYLALENEEIKACVCVVPVTLYCGNKTITCATVGSVSVHPYSRGKGYMRKLMHMAIQDMKKNNISMSTLSGLRNVSAKYCYAAHESRLHQNDRCKRFTLCLVLTVRFRSLAPWGKLFQLFI